MYDKQTSTPLLVAELSNLLVICFFLALFLHRYRRLSTISFTDRFKNYFPKLRIILSLAYVLLSLTLLSYNLLTDSYSDRAWYEYILQGGGGECIDSLILLLQLKVLRLQLRKEQPYTKYHIYYFVYLTLMSVVRFALTLKDVLTSENDLANLVIACAFVGDSGVQLAYWMVKKQSLPQFVALTRKEIDKLRQLSSNQRVTALGVRKNSCFVGSDGFRYIIPTVGLQNGKIRITLQKLASRRSFKQLQIMDQPLIKESLLNESCIQNNEEVELLSNYLYKIKEIQHLYVVCGHFMLEGKVQFASQDMGLLVRSLQEFMEQVFKQKRCYHLKIFRALKIDAQQVQQYLHLTKKSLNDQMDAVSSLRLPEDKNATFCSLICYRSLLIAHERYFYFKTILAYSRQTQYSAKKYTDIEEIHHHLKRQLKQKGYDVQLPALPKAYLFDAAKQQAREQQLEFLIQDYLRRLCNTDTLMEITEMNQKICHFLGYGKERTAKCRLQSIRHLSTISIRKQTIAKALINKDLVTLFGFHVVQNGNEQILKKSLLDFDELHQEMQRRMKSGPNPDSDLVLPSKDIRNSQVLHTKLLDYLQQALKLPGTDKNYPLHSFLNLNHTDQFHPLRSRLSTQRTCETYCLNEPESAELDQSFNSSRFSKNLDNLSDD